MGRPDGVIGNRRSLLVGTLAHNCPTTLGLVCYPSDCSVAQLTTFGPMLEGPDTPLPSFSSLFPPQPRAEITTSAQNNAGQNSFGPQLDGRYAS
jgi:hypothetical protein